MEVEFACEISEEFYCRKCSAAHASHKTDRALNQICLGLQEKLTTLKLSYQKKKKTLINKLNVQQNGIEKIFKIYYDILDTLRNDILGTEYKLREQMDTFEGLTRKVVGNMKKYSVIEFYHEE